LLSTFSSWKYAVLIFLNIPFEPIGGFVVLWGSGLYRFGEIDDDVMR